MSVVSGESGPANSRLLLLVLHAWLAQEGYCLVCRHLLLVGCFVSLRRY